MRHAHLTVVLLLGAAAIALSSGLEAWWGQGRRERSFSARLVPESVSASRMVFEPNRGQVASDIEFIMRGRGYSLSLRPSEAVFAWSAGSRPEPHRLAMKLAGASVVTELEGLQPLGGHSSYFLGRDPENWISRVPHLEPALNDVLVLSCGIHLLSTGTYRQKGQSRE